MDSSEESLPPQSQTAQSAPPSTSKIPFGLPERTSRHWDRKVKERVLLELDAGNSVGVLSNRYGIPRRTIRNWKSRGINNSYGSGGGSTRTANVNLSLSSSTVSSPAAIKQQYLMGMSNGNPNNSINRLDTNSSSNCLLTRDQEKMLYERIQRLSEFNQAAIKEDKLQEIAYDFLEEYGIEHNFEYGKVDANWLDKFLYRNRNLGKLFTFISNEFYDLNNANNDNNLEIINNALLTIKSGGKINIVAKKFNINEEILCTRLKKESLIKPLLSNQQEIKLIQKLNSFKFPASPNLIILTKSKIRAEAISFLSMLGINYNHKTGYDWITDFVSQYYLQIYHQSNSNRNNNNNNNNINDNSHKNNNNIRKYDNNSNSDDDEFRNSLNNIKDATEDIKSGIPIRIVALKYNLPYQILRKWYSIETFLNKKHELYFVNSIKQMRLTKALIKNLLYEYCEKNLIQFQFTNQDDNTDNYDDDDDFNYWYENFIEKYSQLDVVVTEGGNSAGSRATINNPTGTTSINNTITKFKQGATFFNRDANQSTPLRIAAVYQNVNTNSNQSRNNEEPDDDENNDDDDDDENDNDAKDNNGDDTEQNSSPTNLPSDDDGDEHELQIDEDNDDGSDPDDDDQNNDDTNNEPPNKNNNHDVVDGSQSNDFSTAGVTATAAAVNFDDATDIINDLQNEANKDDDDIKFDYSLLNTDFYNDVTNYYENENDDLNAAKRKRWDNETKQKILECISAGESVAAVSDRYKVPKRTIQNWKSIYHETCEDFKKGILKLEEEFDLISKLQVLKQNGAVITKQKFLEMVYSYCEEHKIKHPFRNGQAGRKWYKNFVKRHPHFSIEFDESLGDIPDDSFYENDSIL